MSLVDRIFLRERSYMNLNYRAFRSQYFSYSISPQWLSFLPWNISIEQGVKYGFIPKIGRGLAYEVPKCIVGITPQISTESLHSMEGDLENKKKLYNLFPEIISGFSVGTFPASYFSQNHKLKRLNLTAPGARLGQNIWSAPLTQWVRKEAENEGFTSYQIYDEYMRGVNPIDCSQFFPEDTRIIYGTKDSISPAKSVEELINSMKTTPRIKKLPFGHVTTLLLSSNFIRK